jgi:hypothetical protein
MKRAHVYEIVVIMDSGEEYAHCHQILHLQMVKMINTIL